MLITFIKKHAITWFIRSVFSFFLLSFLITLCFRWIDPPTTAFMLRHQLLYDSQLKQQWVPLVRISSHLPIAVVAAEDQKFPEHFGFDLESINDAFNDKNDRGRGASTITQQLAKNLYLWPGRSLIRKGLEAYFAVLIELTWSKTRILEVYLNVVEFGSGIYGAEAASRTFFEKPSGKLTAYEAALLVAVLPNPKKMSVRRPSAYVQQRASDIHLEVRRLGGSGYLAEL